MSSPPAGGVAPRARTGSGPALALALALAWALFVGAANAGRMFSLQTPAPNDAALFVQVLHAVGEGRGMELSIESTPLERPGCLDRAHFSPIFLALGRLDPLLGGPAPWFLLFSAWFMSASVPTFLAARRLCGPGWAWLAAAGWALYPFTLRAGLHGLRETMLMAPLLAWALWAGLAGRIGLFLWAALLAMTCREEGAAHVALLAIPLALLGARPRRARLGLAGLALLTGLLGAWDVGLFRTRFSEFSGTHWFPALEQARAWEARLAGAEAPAPVPLSTALRQQLAPNCASEVADDDAWRRCLDRRVEVLRAMALPALLPAALAPELLVAAAPPIWASVFAFHTVPVSIEEVAKDERAPSVHAAGALPPLFLGLVLGLSRLSRALARLAGALRVPTRWGWISGALVAGLWLALWTWSPQGPLGALPWPDALHRPHPMACLQRVPLPAARPDPWGIAARMLTWWRPCAPDLAALRALDARIPEDAVLLVESTVAPLFARRHMVFVEDQLVAWGPRWQRRCDRALLLDPGALTALGGRWEREAAVDRWTLWRRDTPR